MAKKAVVETVAVPTSGVVFVRKSKSVDARTTAEKPWEAWEQLQELMLGVVAECHQRGVMPREILVAKKELRWDVWLEAEVRG